MPGGDSQRLRVIHLTDASGGGVRVHLRRILPGLSRAGVDTHLLVATARSEPDFEADEALLRNAGCRVMRVPDLRASRPFACVRAVAAVRRTLRALGPAILHCHATRAGIVGRLAARGREGIRSVYSPHSFAFERCPPGVLRAALRLPERLLAPRTDAFAFVSEAERELACRELGLDASRTLVAPNALPEGFAEALLSREESRARLGLPADGILIGVPGRLCRQKGQDVLLAALARPGCALGDATVVLVGEGPSRVALEHRAGGLPNPGAVRFAGYVPGLERLYAAFDLVVLPSRFEGLSYALLEAAGAGVPVVATDIPANRAGDALGAAVEYVAPEDPAALAAALSRFPARCAERRAEAQSGRAAVLAAFSPRVQLDRLRACYEALAFFDRRRPFFFS